MTRPEFDTAIEALTPALRDTLMQLALDNAYGVTDEAFIALEQAGLIIACDVNGKSGYRMPTHLHIQCLAWMSEAYEAPKRGK